MTRCRGGAAGPGAPLAVLLLVACAGPPDDAGPADGRLRPCPPTPNCVSTRAGPDDEEHRVEPIALPTSAGPASGRMDRIVAAIAEMPRTRLVERDGAYARFEARTRWLRFVDDVEVALADDGATLHLRSASRVGRSDMGVNRARAEAIRGLVTRRLGGR